MPSYNCNSPKCSAAFDTNNELWSHVTAAHPGMSIRGEPEHDPPHTVSRSGGQRNGSAVAQGASPWGERDHVTPRGRDRGPAGGAGRGGEVAPAMANRVGPRAKCVSDSPFPISELTWVRRPAGMMDMQAVKLPPREGGGDPSSKLLSSRTAQLEIAPRNPDSTPRKLSPPVKRDASQISVAAEVSPKENKPPSSGTVRRTRAPSQSRKSGPCVAQFRCG
jgi:hypothetical protein